MFTIRCTQKLLARLGSAPVTIITTPDTVLGDWYANLIRVGRMQVVLAVSERTLLPLVVPAKESRRLLVPRLIEALGEQLLSIGVPQEDVQVELQAMQSSAIAKTANRRVLGSLNDLAFQLETGIKHSPDRSLMELSLWLAKTPLTYIEQASPKYATVAAFATRRALSKFVA
ncbi:DUF6933 domain-containing protein [Delftia sp. ZNC0008]|uniref:DUF6933 domain-containing protein n=1 Tax=unclassified Delftia TaxID=2613839 RepID=UPI00068B6A84